MPLTNKNYMQKFDARKLALRITDECAKPFLWISKNSEIEDVLRIQNESIYRVKIEKFAKDIESQIYKARRNDEINLNK